MLTRETILRARRDPAVFADYVLRDRLTGVRWILPDYEWEWSRIFLSDEKRVIVQAPVNRGKSAFWCEAIYLFQLGQMSHAMRRHQSLGLVCVTDDLADPRIITLRTYIEQAEADRGNLETIGGRLAAVWPNLRRERRDARASKWTDSEFRIEGAPLGPDSSVVGGGIASKRFGGKRFGFLGFDDPESEPELVESEAWRKKADRWIWGQASGRVERVTGRFFMWGTPGYPVGSPGHPGGPMAEAERMGFVTYRFPGPGLPADEYQRPRTMMAHDPVRWGPAELAEERQKYPAKRHEQLVWLRPFTSSDRFFSPDSVDLSRGLGNQYPMLPGLARSERGGDRLVLGGIDHASGEGGDYTAFSLSLYGGAVDQTLHLRRGHWQIVEALRNLLACQRAYDVDAWASEGNAVQKWFRQAARSPEIMAALGTTPDELRRIRVLDTKTGSMDKTDPEQIQSLALDLESGKRAIQGGVACPEGEILLTEILCWTTSGHTGDYLSALWQETQLKRRLRDRVPQPRNATPTNTTPRIFVSTP